MKKKVLSLLLSLFLAVSLMPAGALAEGSSVTSNGDGTQKTPSFDDVKADAWYYEAVQSAAQNSLMQGVNDKDFAPESAMTRGMLTTVLYRLDGSKKSDKAPSFSDVKTADWFSNAVGWAAANGIVTGYGDGTFGAGDNVTRQQAALMFQRFAKYSGRITEGSADLSVYADTSEISDWALSSMGWAVSEGLISGTDSKSLMPSSFVTRAQTAAFLTRYMNGSALEKRTASYISQIVKGNYDDLYAASSAQMQQSVSKDTLLQGWNKLTAVTGNTGVSLGSVYVKSSGKDVVVSSIQGILYNIQITLTYGSDGKVETIWSSLSPLTPPAPKSADKWQEVPVTVGEKNLPGMLTLPKGVDHPPVVLMIQGSGSSDMNESLGTAPNRPFEDIAHGLAEKGVATLRYNKATYQYPTAKCDSVEDEILNDAAAAVKLLSSDNRVDTSRIYLLGHSLGGMMAPKITADNPQIKGFITLAGSLRRLQDLSLDQSKAAINTADSLTPQQKSDMLKQVEAEIENTKTLNDGGTGYIMNVPTSYWKSLNDIDVTAIVKNLSVPMLIMQGSADFQVYQDIDYKLWQTTLQGRSNVTFKLYNGLSHLFMPNQVSTNGAPDTSCYNAPNHVDPQVISDIASWVIGIK